MQDIMMLYRAPDGDAGYVNPFTREAAEAALRYHQGFPEYAPTKLHHLTALARETGVADIMIKDESTRFSLNAFKVLGGSYAIGRVLQQQFDLDELSFAALTDSKLRSRMQGACLVTATDGNHGRGVAWTAQRLGLRSVVFLPKGSAKDRVENIRAHGADVRVTDLNYDDTVRLARQYAAQNGCMLVQDTAWAGYEEIPLRIMQGYTTMGCEMLSQLQGARPTHVFLQAGVGAMAAALAGYLSEVFSDAPPKFIIVEPHNANCFYRSAEANALKCVGGDLQTIMAGLACGEPCTIAWELLRRRAQYFISAADSIAAEGMRVLAKQGITSGESGASSFGCAYALLKAPAYRQQLQLNENSKLLMISTEGDTDPVNYRRIVHKQA